MPGRLRFPTTTAGSRWRMWACSRFRRPRPRSGKSARANVRWEECRRRRPRERRLEMGSNGDELGLAKVRGLQALGAAGDVQPQGAALRERLEPLALNRREVNEDVFAPLLRDEPETLCFVEPLHRATSHSLLLKNRIARSEATTASRSEEHTSGLPA